MNYQEQNDALIESFLNRTFFEAWRNPENEKLVNFGGLEIDLNFKCNLGCKYCYISRYGEQLYPSELYADEDKLLHNLGILLDWVLESNFHPRRIELFSGEPMVQPVAYKALHMIIDRLAGKIKSDLLVPTNYTFILSENLISQVEELLSKSRKMGLPISLSASFDGKYCEGNRPFRSTIKEGWKDRGGIFHWKYKEDVPPDPRDDKYYDRAFDFAKKWGFGFHPMIYSENVDRWIANFRWFQEHFKKRGIPFDNIYLLEVRNPEWSAEQTKNFGKFVEFLIHWTLENPCEGKRATFVDFLFRSKGYNILTSPLTRIGRGLGCSYQSMMYVRMGDMALMPCHRTAYEPFMLGRFKIESDKIVGIHAKNPELWIGGIAANADHFPYCERCVIKTLCSHGCLGAQFETTGDLFTPIPTMCRMEHEKVWAMIRAYKDIGVYDDIMRKTAQDKSEAFKYMEEILYKR